MYIPPQTIITIDQKPTWTVKSITPGRNQPKREERSCKKARIYAFILACQGAFIFLLAVLHTFTCATKTSNFKQVRHT